MQVQGTIEHRQESFIKVSCPPSRTAGIPSTPEPDWLDRWLGLNALDWLSGKGPEADVAISSRLRLARNLSCHAFPEIASSETLNQVAARIEAAVRSRLPGWLVLDSGRLSEQEGALLRERHLLACKGGFASTGQGYHSLAIHDEDHLRFQALRAGLSLEKSLPELMEIACDLESVLGFARSERLGYLTSCPSNLGTGLRASVLLHLPALSWLEALPEVVRKVARVGGMTLRGLHGEDSSLEGSFLQLSNQVTLGRSEVELVKSVQHAAVSLIAWERQARERLLQTCRQELEDAVWRARGLLASARLMGKEEALDLLGMVRLGYLCGLLHDPDGAARTLRLLVGSGDAHLEWMNRRSLSERQTDLARATFLREAFS
jgi:protein arginine kinase